MVKECKREITVSVYEKIINSFTLPRSSLAYLSRTFMSVNQIVSYFIINTNKNLLEIERGTSYANEIDMNRVVT